MWFFIEINTVGISPISFHSECVAGPKNSVSVDQILNQVLQSVCVETAKATTKTTAAQRKPRRKSTTAVRNKHKREKNPCDCQSR